MNPRTAIEINTGILEEARMNSPEENWEHVKERKDTYLKPALN